MPEVWQRRLGQGESHLVLLLLFLAVMSSGLWMADRLHLARVRHETQGILRAVTASKIRAAAEWRRQRLAEVAVIQSDPLQTESVRRLTQGDETAKRQLTQRFAQVCEQRGYLSISVFDGNGVNLLAVPLTEAESDGPQSRGIRTVLAARKPVEAALSRRADGRLRLNLWVPLMEPTGQVFAVILLAATPEQSLMPELQAWPVPSASATTLLVRPEGSQVAILNRAATQGDGARDLLFPITANLPAARAARGEEGFLEGLSESGRQVFAFSGRVPDTSWLVVTQIDQAEVFAAASPWQEWTAPVILGVLAMAALVVYGMRSGAAGGFQQRLKTEAASRRLAQKYQALVEQLPAVTYMAAPDRPGLLYVSRQVAEVTGFSQEEWLADPGRWERQIHPEDRERVMAAAAKARGSRDLVSIVYRLIRKDGSVWWCRDRMAMVCDEAGNPEFISGVFFDVTELQEARQRLEMLEAVVVHSKDGILIARPSVEEPLKSTIVYVNDAVLRQTGYRREECVGQPVSLLYGTEPSPAAMEEMGRAVLGKGPAMFECVNYRKDGAPYWSDVSLFPLVNHRNQGTLVVGIRRDITGRRQMEAALRSSEALLRGIADSVPALIWKRDLTGNASFLNRQFQVFTGIPVEAGLGYGWIEAVHPDDRGRVLSADFLESGEFELEYRLRGADGQYRWMFAKAKPQSRDGKIESLVVSSIDITDRKQMEEDLRRSQIRIRVAERAGGVGFWERNLRTDRAKWSEGACRLYGIDPASPPPTTAGWLALVHADDRGPLEEQRNRALEGRGPYVRQYRVIWPDGSIHWLASYASVLRDAAGAPEALIGAVIDVTTLRETEQKLEDMNRELRQLSGELLQSQDEERRRLARELHDSVGQNLVGIKMIVSAVTGANEHQRREIAAAVELIDQTSREIRTLSYLLHPPLLDDLGLTSALRAYTTGFTDRTGITVECDLAAELGRLERNTETALFRIVQEALGNIHRHSGSKSARVGLALRDELVELTVADCGKGIPREILQPGHGGVGLSSMRQRAAQLDGSMGITTGASGTTIMVQLPVRLPPPEQARPQDFSLPETAWPGQAACLDDEMMDSTLLPVEAGHFNSE